MELPVAMRQTRSAPHLHQGGFQIVAVNKMVINNFHTENQCRTRLSMLYKQQKIRSQRLLMQAQSTIGRFCVYKKLFDSFGYLATTKMECHHLKMFLYPLQIFQQPLGLRAQARVLPAPL